MRQPIQVLIYPVRRAGNHWKFLLLRRIPSRGGFWQGVTGGVEEGETLIEAARRELLEETGLIPIALAMIDYSYSFPIEDKWRHLYALGVERITEYVFVAHVGEQKEPTIDSNEHDQYRWCSLEEALRLLTWPENKEALKKCNALVAGTVINNS